MGEFTNIYRKICDYRDYIGIVEEISNLIVELHLLEARPSSLHCPPYDKPHRLDNQADQRQFSFKHRNFSTQSSPLPPTPVNQEIRKMDIEYRRIIGGNFGDDMNSWFWERLSPGGWNETENTLLGIGSLLGSDRDPRKVWHVIGSGAGYRYPLDLSSSKHWNFLAVRGPLTALALGLSEEKGCTDTAILLALMSEFEPLPEEEREGIIFIPHHGAAENCEWDSICEAAGVKYIDPRIESKEVIETIRKSKLVLSGAMHAAIIADTFRVKWLPITTSSTINHFKWLDWTISMNVPYDPVFVGPGSLGGKIQHFVYKYSWASQKIPANAKEAIAYLKKRNRLGIVHNLKAGLIWKLGTYVERGLRSKPLSKIGKRIDNKATKVAVKTLRTASESRGMLSDDDTFQHRLDKMEEHLNSIIGIKTNEKE